MPEQPHGGHKMHTSGAQSPAREWPWSESPELAAAGKGKEVGGAKDIREGLWGLPEVTAPETVPGAALLQPGSELSQRSPIHEVII